MSNEKKGIVEFVKNVTTDVNVGMNEVVNVFVSQYETQLVDRKKELQVQLTANNKKLKDFEAEIVKGAKMFETPTVSFGPLNVKVKHSSTSADWENSQISITFTISDLSDKSSSYRSDMYTSVYQPISRNDVDSRSDMITESGNLGKEIAEVASLLSQVSRKERQIRGEISKKKLESNGYGDLLKDAELLKLCSF